MSAPVSAAPLALLSTKQPPFKHTTHPLQPSDSFSEHLRKKGPLPTNRWSDHTQAHAHTVEREQMCALSLALVLRRSDSKSGAPCSHAHSNLN